METLSGADILDLARKVARRYPSIYDAASIAAEAILRVQRSKPGNHRGYYFRVAYNQIARIAKDRRTQAERERDAHAYADAVCVETPEHIVTERDARHHRLEIIRNAVAALPPRRRQLVATVYADGQKRSLVSAAAATGISTSAAKVRHLRAMRDLRAYFAVHPLDED